MRAVRPGLPKGLYGLSARLLVLTIAFVMLSEVLIYAPSIARFRRDYLEDRIASAHLATLALEATPDNMVSDELKAELLDHAGALAIVTVKPGQVRRVLARDMPPEAHATYDLRAASFFGLILDALMALTEPGERILRVIGPSPKRDGVIVEVLVPEAEMRAAMVGFSWRILGLSLIISFLTASLVFLSLQWLMVRPLRRLTENVMAFRDAPEDARNAIAPTRRNDEIGMLQSDLAEMEGAVRAALHQKGRLAALGAAITKITHDLRNILATARLVSDRLADSSDPKVARLAPTLVGTIDRAVTLCEQTLSYARESAPAPQRQRFALAELAEEVGGVVAVLASNRAEWRTQIPEDLVVSLDRDQLFRVFVNLGRNAAEAGAHEIRVTATVDGPHLALDIADDGPGIPARVLDRLFQPFAGSAKAGGTGLGLSIAREIVRAHGGDLTLLDTSPQGTVFRIDLPDAVVARARAAV